MPQREGVDAARLVLPLDGPWATLGDHLRDRLTPLGAEGVRRLLASGRVLDRTGHPLADGSAYEPGQVVWVERELAPEPVHPGALTVLHRDARVVVVDKPPFLASMPRGRHVTQTALARARRELGLPGLSLAHRLDRLTAGVLLLVADPDRRGAYQELFARRAVAKTYLAVAPGRGDLGVPTTVRAHLRKERGLLRTTVVPGAAPNSETRVTLLERRGELGLYRLEPVTGRTHQLRAHLALLGTPIVGDPLYGDPLYGDPLCGDPLCGDPLVGAPRHGTRAVPPAGTGGGPAPDDHDHPLQLLAARLAFTDPVDGSARRFASRRTLVGWSADELARVLDRPAGPSA